MPEPPGAVASRGWSVDECRALLAHLREVAEGLTPLQRSWLFEVFRVVDRAAPGNRGDVRCLLNMQAKHLVREVGQDHVRLFDVTDMGKAVARYLERQQ